MQDSSLSLSLSLSVFSLSLLSPFRVGGLCWWSVDLALQLSMLSLCIVTLRRALRER